MRIRLAGLAVLAWLAVAALGAQGASALSPGSFSLTGQVMTTQREGAVAAPLPDGRVLVAGGYYFDGSSHYLSSAEIFNPATGSFSPTGAMSVAREYAAAAPLPDGRVLVAGGFSPAPYPSSIPQSAEIFDPATGAFSPTGDLTVDRSGAAAAPLPDGRVLVAGGQHAPSAEIFDPATGSFSATGSMTVPRWEAAAAPLPDGRVLVAGGYNGSDDSSYSSFQSAEIFNPATGAFSPTGSMTVPRSGAVAAPLPDGRVLVAGGVLGPGYGGSAEIFDPTTNTFSPTGSMYRLRDGAAAAPLPDGRVLVAGGCCYYFTAQESAELFQPALSFTLRGKRLTVSVAVAGTLRVKGAKARLGRSAGAASKSGPSLKQASTRGGPGSIKLKLKLAEWAQRRLERTGKVSVRARLAFAPVPVRGKCVTLVKPCYSRGYAITQTTTLALKAKKRR